MNCGLQIGKWNLPLTSLNPPSFFILVSGRNSIRINMWAAALLQGIIRPRGQTVSPRAGGFITTSANWESYIYAHTNIYIYIYMCVCVCVYICVCVCVYIYIYIYIWFSKWLEIILKYRYTHISLQNQEEIFKTLLY